MSKKKEIVGYEPPPVPVGGFRYEYLMEDDQRFVDAFFAVNCDPVQAQMTACPEWADRPVEAKKTGLARMMRDDISAVILDRVRWFTDHAEIGQFATLANLADIQKGGGDIGAKERVSAAKATLEFYAALGATKAKRDETELGRGKLLTKLAKLAMEQENKEPVGVAEIKTVGQRE